MFRKNGKVYIEKINGAFSKFRKVDEDLLEELEEALIMSDIGIETSTKIISNLRDRIKKEKIEDEEQIEVTFPVDANPEEKSVFIAAGLLVGYLYYQNTSQRSL